MTDITRILSQIEHGDPLAADELLPLVYDELRRLAAVKMAQEKPGQTLQATALVNEAYLRLVGANNDTKWEGRGHFFGAAAEAMRRILIEQARKKKSLKAGGDLNRVNFTVVEPETPNNFVDLLALDECLEQLSQHDDRACQVVKLRYFAGLTVPQVASALGVSVSTIENDWAYAKSWLKKRLSHGQA